MAEDRFRFSDGAAYERMMGTWSGLVGDVFLDWLAPEPQLKWIDVGCGNGAFTERIVERCRPAEVQGIDPSDAQLAYARGRPAARLAEFRKGDAMALPFADARFDAAVMALVIFFVPDPAKCVAEMARVVRPGGRVVAYAWDMRGGGFPLAPVGIEARGMGLDLPRPPSVDASRMEALQALWAGAGLTSVETREITVERTFDDFDDFWTTGHGSSLGAALAAVEPEVVERLRTRVRDRLPADGEGRITTPARANAIKGRVPA